jgi:hypothetical protein
MKLHEVAGGRWQGMHASASNVELCMRQRPLHAAWCLTFGSSHNLTKLLLLLLLLLPVAGLSRTSLLACCQQQCACHPQTWTACCDMKYPTDFMMTVYSWLGMQSSSASLA